MEIFQIILLPGSPVTLYRIVWCPDKISDHMVLYASLVWQRPHAERKYIFVPAQRRINNDSLEADLPGINIAIDCEDVNVVVAQHDTSLSRLLDKLAP